MWSKMLLFSLNIYILLSLVDGDNSEPLKTQKTTETTTNGKINFLPTMNPKCKDKNITAPNVTQNIITTPNVTQNIITTPNVTQSIITTPNVTQNINETIRIQDSSNMGDLLTLGLLNATLNIDRAIDRLHSTNPIHDKNIIVSPICLAAALSIVLLGANGTTKTEVGKLFGFNENTLSNLDNNNYQPYQDLGILLNYFQVNSGENLGTEVNLAKAIFVQKGYNIEKQFETAVKQYLKSELKYVDFELDGEAAQNHINKWVSDITHGKIKDIMPDVPLPETKTIIASALYFIGEWENPFSSRYTRSKPFYTSSMTGEIRSNKQCTDNCIYVPMMVGNSEVFYHRNENLKFRAIGLPYKGRKFITYFVLPDTNVSLREMVKQMNGNTIKNITNQLTTKVTEITYFVPKMTLKSTTNLQPVLKNLGMTHMFDPSTADFSNMSLNKTSYISDILHQVEIDINEQGTVAAAATVITVTRGGQANFNVNKPFIFFIHHVKSDTVVFWSTVYEPTPHSKTP